MRKRTAAKGDRITNGAIVLQSPSQWPTSQQQEQEQEEEEQQCEPERSCLVSVSDRQMEGDAVTAYNR